MAPTKDEATMQARRRVRRPMQGYHAPKAAQVAAYILLRCHGQMSKLKLAKMLYLVERRFAQVHGYPLFMDRYVAIEHGPVCSGTLSGLDGEADQEIWGGYIARRDSATIEVLPGTRLEQLEELSADDRRVADEVIAEFGPMSPSRIRRWTHENLPEYREREEGLKAGAKSLEIAPRDMARAFGHPDPARFVKAVAVRKKIGGP